MDQDVIAAFKAYYIQGTFSKLIDDVDNQQVSIKESWKSYNMLSTTLKKRGRKYHNTALMPFGRRCGPRR
jgi:hypothetical protein